jgi:phage terminase large subunit-like protein
MKKKHYLRIISAQDHERRMYLLETENTYGVAWKALDDRWKRKYGYSLRVQDVFDFIEHLIVPSGKGAGKNFILRGFEKKFIADIYGPTNENRARIVRRAILSVARKNGKTALIACLVLVHLVGPEAIMNGEIYSAANEREQAAIVFKYAAQIVRADPELLSMIKVIDSTKTMVAIQTGSVYRALSAEAGTKMGLNPTVVIYDELAQAKNRDLYDALDTSMAARDEPLYVVISTQSNDPQHILSQLIDDGLSGLDPTTVCHLYAVEDDVEDERIFNDERLWRLANPALGQFRSLAEMRTASKRAKRMPSFESSFRNLYLNQRVDAESPLIPRAEWIKCKKDGAEIAPGSDIYLALDLSGKIDLSALVAISASPESSVVRPWFWKPKELVRQHEKRDRVPYVAWAKKGLLETTLGKVIQYDFIATRIAEISREYNIIGLAYDRWKIDDLLKAMDAISLEYYVDKKKSDPTGDPKLDAERERRQEYLEQTRSSGIRLIPWGQGFKDMGPAIDAMEASILDSKLVHDGNPILTWNISNAMVVTDPAGNRKIDKSKSRFRIDGAVALAMAEGVKSRDKYGQPSKSSYEEMTVEEITQRIAI